MKNNGYGCVRQELLCEIPRPEKSIETESEGTHTTEAFFKVEVFPFQYPLKQTLVWWKTMAVRAVSVKAGSSQPGAYLVEAAQVQGLSNTVKPLPNHIRA